MHQNNDAHISLFSLPGAEENQAGKSSWAVPWSDLMLVMFILFLVLFVFHTRETLVRVPVNQDGHWNQAVQNQSSSLQLQGLYTQAREKLSTPGAPVSVKMTEQGSVLISLFGEVFFSPGSADLNPESNKYLQQIAEIVSLAQGQVKVAGFTDSRENSVQGDRSIFEISAMRAARIGEELTRSRGLRQENLVIQGHGTPRPQVPENSPVGSELNRRVEIRIVDS